MGIGRLAQSPVAVPAGQPLNMNGDNLGSKVGGFPDMAEDRDA
jgi:hypothetical protein